MAETMTATNSKAPAPDPASPRAAGDAATAAGAGGSAMADAEVGLFAPLYPLPRLEIVEGRGARVRDKQGREYLDFVSGIAVNAFGHAPTGLQRAISRQMKSLV